MNAKSISSPTSQLLDQVSTLELAQALAERLMVSEKNWHQLKNNRVARASEQTATALVYLVKADPQEALPRLEQACGWLDRSVSAPPCPSHGTRGN